MAETARMRGLLAELGRLGAEEAEAPTRLEGIGSVGRGIWNRNFWMSAGYVADRCAEVLAVCGERLESPEPVAAGQVSQKKQMQWLESALRWQKVKVRLVVWLDNGIDTDDALRRLTGKRWHSEQMEQLKKMKTDDLAVKLKAFLEAMDLYRERYKRTGEFKKPFLRWEQDLMRGLVTKIDAEREAREAQEKAEREAREAQEKAEREARRIQERLQTYYDGPPPCPPSLIMAKRKRTATNGGGSDHDKLQL